MSGQVLVSVHLPRQMLRDLDAAVRAGVFRCRSEAIRIAIKKLLESYGLGADVNVPACNEPTVARTRQIAIKHKANRVPTCNGYTFEELWKMFLDRLMETIAQYKSNAIGVIPYDFVVEKCRKPNARMIKAIVKALENSGCVRYVIKRNRRLKVLLDKKCVEEIKSVENIAKDKLDTQSYGRLLSVK